MILILSLCGYSQVATTAQPDYDAIAHKIVNYTLEVQPAEVVIITGTPAELDLLSALSLAVFKAGGQPTVEVNFPQTTKRAIMEMPFEYLKIMPTYALMQVRSADCFINTGSTQDIGLFADVPEERLAALRQASRPLNDAYRRTHFRQVGLGQTGGIPTKSYAESMGANYEEMLAMFWKSVDADYSQMYNKGKAISGQLRPGSEIKITSDAGTDLTFRISDIPARINCGRCADNISASGPAGTWLPAGEVYACVDPSSASGTMVIPKVDFRGNAVINMKLTFDNGRVTNIEADENGELISKALELSTGDKDVLSVMDIGINPNSQPLENSDYYSWEMAGMVTMSIGINLWAGGNVDSDNGLFFHLANSTVTVDGNTIVTGGKL